ncbi:MAG: hypothetical protein U5K31_10040 [Balneolaceae bacterium]|nr:hypothetical protein [Balneolaceae bacterium]
MKRLLIILGILSMGALLAFPMQAQSTYKTGTTIRINESDSLEGNIIAAGQLVEVMGHLNNDLFSASRYLTLNGSVSDDALLAAQLVSVHGSVGDMVLALGETVVVDGRIEGDLFAAGRTVRITGDAWIGGNAFLAGSSVIFESGTVGGALRVAGEEINLDGTVLNFVEIYGSGVTFGENYAAEYSTSIWSSEPVHRENLGNLPPDLTITVDQPSVWSTILWTGGIFLSLLISGLVLIRIFERTAVDLQRFATERFWKNTGIGLASFLLIPLMALVLLVLVFTIPLSIILWVLYGLSLLAGYLLVAMILGAAFILYFREETSTSVYYWGLALGMLLLGLLVNLPWIGGLINLLLLFFGLGSLVRYTWVMSRGEKGEGVAEDM